MVSKPIVFIEKNDLDDSNGEIIQSQFSAFGLHLEIKNFHIYLEKVSWDDGTRALFDSNLNVPGLKT